jgi:isoleucyl-tRNA synthetase
VGPKYGKQLGGIKKYLEEADGTLTMKRLKEEGALHFEVDGTAISLTEEDLLIDVAQKAGFVTEADNYVTVVLDTNLSPELIEEGFVYEVISKIQTMRKDSGFEVMDHIRVTVNGNPRIAEIVENNKAAISEKVLADEITADAALAVSREWNVNGEKVVIGIEKI